MKQIKYLEIKKLKIKYFFSLFVIFIFSQLIHDGKTSENRILFKINNQIITTLDIAFEIKYLKTINEDYAKLDNLKAIEIAKRSLVREKIKQIQLKKIFKDLKIDESFLNNFAVNNFKRFGINSKADFENFFLSQGINPNSIKEKIKIEILWNQLIYNKFHKNVKIDLEKIKKELLKNNKQKEYLISEILFNLNEDEKLDEKLKIIKKVINEKSFSQAALTFSISNTNNNGGNLGWVKESVLSGKIKNQINKTKVGEITDVIIIPGGFLILKIQQSRISEKDLNFEKELEIIVDKKTNEQLNQFSNIYFNKVKKNIVINELS